MKEYKTFETLKAECSARVKAFEAVRQIHYGLFSEDGELWYDAYDYINDCFIWASDAIEFVQKAAETYRDLVSHYERLSEYEKQHTWNNPEVHRLIRRYVRHNFPPELREQYPEFALKNNRG